MLDVPELRVEVLCHGLDLNTPGGDRAAVRPQVEQLDGRLLAWLALRLSLALVDDELLLEVGQELEILLLLEKHTQV